MSASEEFVTLAVDEQDVAIVRLNRPDQGNAINLEMAERLVELVNKIDASSSVRAVLLTGTGRFFCVGGDIGAFKAAGEAVPTLLKQITVNLHMAISRLARMEKPLIVAVNGPAAGAGLNLAALGDIVLSARSAHYSMAYTAIGLTPDAGATWLLPRLIGMRRVQELALTNRRVGSEEAAQIGLVTCVVDDEQLLAEAHRRAAALAEGPTLAFAAIRRLLLSTYENGLEGQLEAEARAISGAAATPEGREGVRAFLEKRTANFRTTGHLND